LRYRCFKEIVEEYDLYERQKKRNNIWSVTNGFEPISINAYKEIFYEIKHLNPDYIVLPCGSGDTIIGIRLAIKEFSMTTKIIACGPKNEHPLKFALLF
jgi:threonine synthase